MLRNDQDEMSAYFDALAHCHPPTPDEMKKLAWRWINDGDGPARDEMIRRNLRLVVATVRRHVFGNVPYADFVADGNLALIRAVDKWDPALGLRFATYATWWIRQSVWRRLSRSPVPIHVPPDMARLVARLRATRARLEHQLGRPPCPREISQALDLPPRRARSLAQAATAMHGNGSGHAERDPDDPRMSIPEIAVIRRPEDAQIRRDELSQLRRAVRNLDPRSAYVLTCRFGLDRLPPRTLLEVGRELGLTRESIRLIERRALEQLKAVVA